VALHDEVFALALDALLAPDFVAGVADDLRVVAELNRDSPFVEIFVVV